METGAVTGQPKTLDSNQFGQHLVTVTVDKEPITVTLKQALEGFMRQSDYSNKTAAVARERERLKTFEESFQKYDQWFTSLKNDPEGTLRALAGHYRVDLGGVSNVEDGSDPEVLELRAELAGMKTQLEQATRTTASVAAEQELATSFPELALDDVKSYAVANGMAETELMTAAKLMSFDRLREKAELEHAAQQQQQQIVQGLAQEKASLPPVAAGGLPAQSVDTPVNVPELPSFEQAVQMAELELGP